jgi:hypothetical protein
VGCKVDDFSISEKDEDVKDYSGEEDERWCGCEGEASDGEDDYEGYGEERRRADDKTGVDEIYIMKCNIDTMIVVISYNVSRYFRKFRLVCQYIKGKNRVLLH